MSVYSIPKEILAEVFHHVPYEKSNWMNIIRTCKLFNEVGKKVFHDRYVEEVGYSLYSVGN